MWECIGSVLQEEEEEEELMQDNRDKLLLQITLEHTRHIFVI